MANEQNDVLRTKIEALVQRIECDPTLAQQAQDDPAGVLRAAGLPDGEIVGYLHANPDVVGHARCLDTCIQSICIGSCVLTAGPTKGSCR